MSHYVSPPPARRADYASVGQIMGWMVLLGLAFWPRLFILGFWIFDRTLRDAFDSWIIAAVGFFVLPWTTLASAGMWSAGTNIVHGFEWFIVGVAFVVDVGSYAGSRSAPAKRD